MEPRELLLADLEHFGESMWRNEEVGEKRLNFFVTLMTAVAAGLVALATSSPPVNPELFQQTAIAGLGALLIIGLLTYLRMIHRNRVTDQYQATLGYIREAYRSRCPDWAKYDVPQDPKPRTSPWLRGGYAETFAVLNGMLLAGLLLVGYGERAELALGGGAILAVGLVALAGHRKKQTP